MYHNVWLLNVAPPCKFQSPAQRCRSTRCDCALVTMKVRRAAPLPAICFSLRLAVINGSIAPLLSRPAADRNLIRHQRRRCCCRQSQCPSLLCQRHTVLPLQNGPALPHYPPPEASEHLYWLISLFCLFKQTLPALQQSWLMSRRRTKRRKIMRKRRRWRQTAAFRTTIVL